MKNNKGFSLVELIIVVAIMAVLIGVLAPQYLKYVEKSRVSSDKTAIANVIGAMNTALADEDVYPDVPASGSITVTNGKQFSKTSNDVLEKAIASTIPDKIDLGSKTYKSKTFTINYSFTGGNWSVDDIDKVMSNAQ